ncbi:hypothetical protein PACTADRAFT_15275 [Pachysolen tannophilus NRRL Y-2460]|uniref:Uncharacterized protein n=1 Tax=Pachysolen tannophilus NRRL Y-2460 TaxID=669874 RepID=A0A1E4TYD1_PACTA|nr:hypothetical protein PACTADRAFT_15275 [Pachysolen tannophilus NRRL Y-2460]
MGVIKLMQYEKGELVPETKIKSKVHNFKIRRDDDDDNDENMVYVDNLDTESIFNDITIFEDDRLMNTLSAIKSSSDTSPIVLNGLLLFGLMVIITIILGTLLFCIRKYFFLRNRVEKIRSATSMKVNDGNWSPGSTTVIKIEDDRKIITGLPDSMNQNTIYPSLSQLHELSENFPIPSQFDNEEYNSGQPYTGTGGHVQHQLENNLHSQHAPRLGNDDLNPVSVEKCKSLFKKLGKKNKNQMEKYGSAETHADLLDLANLANSADAPARQLLSSPLAAEPSLLQVVQNEDDSSGLMKDGTLTEYLEKNFAVEDIPLNKFLKRGKYIYKIELLEKLRDTMIIAKNNENKSKFFLNFDEIQTGINGGDKEKICKQLKTFTSLDIPVMKFRSSWKAERAINEIKQYLMNDNLAHQYPNDRATKKIYIIRFLSIAANSMEYENANIFLPTFVQLIHEIVEGGSFISFFNDINISTIIKNSFFCIIMEFIYSHWYFHESKNDYINKKFIQWKCAPMIQQKFYLFKYLINLCFGFNTNVNNSETKENCFHNLQKFLVSLKLTYDIIPILKEASKITNDEKLIILFEFLKKKFLKENINIKNNKNNKNNKKIKIIMKIMNLQICPLHHHLHFT